MDVDKVVQNVKRGQYRVYVEAARK